MHPRFLSAVLFILGAFGSFIFFASQNVLPTQMHATPVAVTRQAQQHGAVLGATTNRSVRVERVVPSRLTVHIHDTVYVSLRGEGFVRGMKVFVGSYEVKHQVKSPTIATLALPMKVMDEGRYDVRVVLPDQSISVLPVGIRVAQNFDTVPETIFSYEITGAELSVDISAPRPVSQLPSRLDAPGNFALAIYSDRIHLTSISKQSFRTS